MLGPGFPGSAQRGGPRPAGSALSLRARGLRTRASAQTPAPQLTVTAHRHLPGSRGGAVAKKRAVACDPGEGGRFLMLPSSPRPGFLRGASGSVALWGRSGKDGDGDTRWLPPAPRAPESSGRASLVRGRKRGEGCLPLLGGSVAVAVPRGPRRGSGMAKRRFRGTLWPGPAGPSPAAPSGLLGGSREAASGAEGLLADLCGDGSAPLSADLTVRPPGQQHPGKLVASPIFGETRSSL